MLNEQQKQVLKQKLVDNEKELRDTVDFMEQESLGEDMRDSFEELSLIDNHPADVGTEVFERSKDLALRESTELEIKNIDAALERMESGTYGICAHCGKEIPFERLEVVPETDMCVDCKKETRVEDPMVRPVEEYVIRPPWGKRNDFEKRDDEDVMFDGEDSWQAVAQYGSADGPQSVPNNMDYDHNYPDFDEDRGFTEDVDHIPYSRGKDGMIYGLAIEDDGNYKQDYEMPELDE